MKTTIITSSGSSFVGKSAVKQKNARGGFSLIEMVGVLAILAISVSMLLPVLISGTDAAQATQEVTTMQSFATALQLNIQRNHVIPNVTNWVSIVATELGMTSNSVAFNSRGQPRYLLVDSNGFGSLTLPYVETSSGTPNPLTNSTPPRFIFISSLGTALPTAVVGTNYFPTSVDFNALWSCPAGIVPTNVPWTNPQWPGKPSDLTIQRLDLAYVFAHLTLSNLDPTNATYSINGSTPLNLAAANTNNPGTNLMSAYFLTATVLNLYLPKTNLEASQVLNRDSSWVYSGGVWRNAPAPAPAASVTTTNGSSGSAGSVSVGGCVDNDPGDCCHQFNWQRFCTNNANPWSGCNPNTVCNDFTNYMCLYQQYANSNFTNKTCRTALQNCCSQLNNDCGNLCNTRYY